jgi:hypothetical protein
MVPSGVISFRRAASIRRVWPLLVIPAAFGVVVLAAPSRQYHWDTLERAYLLEHPARYIRSWDNSPRSQFLSFAHVLELPLAAIVRAAIPGISGLRALCVFEALVAMALLVLTGLLVTWWRAMTAAGTERDGRWAALAAQATLAAAFAFWRMGSSGEEKTLALATQVLFLGAFWRTLGLGATVTAATEPARVRMVRHAATLAAAALALAILSHLTGAVLVPFAGVALAVLPTAWRPARPALVRALLAASIAVALAYAAVAAWTTFVRSPAEFYRYLTFFHRPAGMDFFDLGAATATPPARFMQVLHGMGSFFAAPPWAHVGVLALLASAAALPAWRRRRGNVDRASARVARAVLHRHALVLGAMWTAHFAWFEPGNHESWTLVAFLGVLLAAVSLPGRSALALAVLPVGLLVANVAAYAAARRPLDYAAYAAVVARDTQPSDVVVLVGGSQAGKPLRGSLGMRYFLAAGPPRVYASLYDVLGVTQPEYWGRPFTTPAALQEAIGAGRRVFVPEFLRNEIERANASGIVRITTVTAGDSLLQITHIAAVSP